MIRIALVEDEAEVRAQLQGYVQRHTRQYGTEFAVTEFADGMELLDDYRPVYDVLFLDVEMKHLDGMETARRVRELDKDVIIVFITNMAQYAIGGYAVGALDYVLKPVPYFAFSQQLRKVEEQLRRRVRHYLDQGRRVLFSGTPCQVDGLYHFLGEHPERLLTCDVVCSGVSSPGCLLYTSPSPRDS